MAECEDRGGKRVEINSLLIVNCFIVINLAINNQQLTINNF